MVSRLPDTLSVDRLPNNPLKKRVKRPKKKPEVVTEKNCVGLVVEFDTTKVLAERSPSRQPGNSEAETKRSLSNEHRLTTKEKATHLS